VTSADSQSPRDSDDPRLLLPEWLRDPGDMTQKLIPPETNEPVSSDDSELVTRSNEAPSQTRGSVSADLGIATRPGREKVTASWQSPPPAPQGVYDPTSLITYDDLPQWVQRLQVDNGSPAAGPILKSTIVEKTSSPTIPSGVEESPATPVQHAATQQQALADSLNATASVNVDIATETALREPNKTSPRRETDLSPARFMWLAGTVLVLILIAMLTLVW
jgi:hypothetical protein